MSGLFAFLTVDCTRCGSRRNRMYKLNEKEWVCLACLTEDEMIQIIASPEVGEIIRRDGKKYR